MTHREAPGGDPPSAATPAQAVDAARVQELRAAQARELTRAQELGKRLAQEQAHAKQVAQSYEQAAERTDAKAKALARRNLTGQPVTPAEHNELAHKLVAQELELALELGRIEAQVQVSAQALERAQSLVQELERALALAMAQVQALARAQARSPRLRAIAVARFLWQLIRAPRGAWAGIIRNLYLGMGIVALPVWMLPNAARARWKHDAYGMLDMLKEEDAPLLGTAIRIAVRTPLLALVLWTGAWSRSRQARWLARQEPLWVGLGWAAATFLTIAAGILVRGQSPTSQQMKLAAAASLLTGSLVTWDKYRERRPPKRKRKR